MQTETRFEGQFNSDEGLQFMKNSFNTDSALSYTDSNSDVFRL